MEPLGRLVFGLGLLLGLVMLVLQPAFSVPDEWPHFLRAYHLSEGKIYAHRENGPTSNVGDLFPVSMWQTMVMLHSNVPRDNLMQPDLKKTAAALDMPLDPGERHFQPFPNTALYSPVPYLPAALAIALSRAAGASPLAMFYCGRAANLIVFLLLAGWAVKTTPILRTSFAILALLPMSLFLSASLSADAMTLGFALCAIAATFRAAFQTSSGQNSAGGRQRAEASIQNTETNYCLPPTDNSLLGSRQLALLVVLFSLLALCKQAYFPLTLLFFIIPVRACGSWRRYLGAAALVIGVPLVLNLGWAATVKPIYFPLMPGVDPAAHLRFTLSRPWGYTLDMLHVMRDDYLWLNMVGILGWQGVILPKMVRIALWVSLGLSAVVGGVRKRGVGDRRLPSSPLLPFRSRMIVLAVYLVGVVAVITLVNLSWQAAGVKGVVGLQSRYFLPLVPLLLLLVGGRQTAVGRVLNLLAAYFRLPIGWAKSPTDYRLLRIVFIVGVSLLGSIASWAALFQHYYT
jgi:uncharacterized membrane protein